MKTSMQKKDAGWNARFRIIVPKDMRGILGKTGRRTDGF
jgi:hypothetical protein